MKKLLFSLIILGSFVSLQCVGAAQKSVSQEEFFEAIKNGDIELVQEMIKNGADVNEAAKDNNGWTPINAAARYGYEKIVQLLIDKGADVDGAGADESTPLHGAVNRGHDKVVQLLIDNKADLNKVDNQGFTPLHRAAYRGHDAIVQLLIDNRADLNKADKYGDTPLHKAAWTGHDKVVQLLINARADLDGANPNKVSSNKAKDIEWTPLYRAAWSGHDKVVQLLIDAGADLNKTDNLYGFTPLYRAASENYDKVVKLLIDAGADPIISFNRLTNLNKKELIVNADAQRLKSISKKDKIIPQLCVGREQDENSFVDIDYLPHDLFQLLIERYLNHRFLEYLSSISNFEYAYMLAHRFYTLYEPENPRNREIVKTLAELHKKLKITSVPFPVTSLKQALEKELKQ